MKSTAHGPLVLACAVLGLAALCAQAVTHPSVRIVYNPTDSVPSGWYGIEALDATDSPDAGRIVLIRLPTDVAAFAAQRGYLPAGVPVLKRIGAVTPQSVCVQDRVVRIDGVAVAAALVHDGEHRPLRAWTQCRRLVGDELFLLSSTNLASFDSRYFGSIARSAVIGSARPLWTARSR